MLRYVFYSGERWQSISAEQKLRELKKIISLKALEKKSQRE